MKPASLTVKDVSFAYPDGQHALHSVSLTVAPGEAVAILGPNGAGKSTLLLHLNGILAPAKGEIWVGELQLNKHNLKEIRRLVGVVFQDPDDQLFMPTVFEDVAFGPLNLGLAEAEIAERVRAALSRVDLEGYERRSAHHLSFGEKKRVCLAAVLAMEPGVLALDEPTSNLDPRGRRRLLELLSAIPLTRIIATHDLDLVRRLCPRAVILDGGRIVADGPSAELLRDETLLDSHGLL
ncbi:MAG: ABC transporter ATP-binding protein [Bacillota bacterium]|nr:ABC transporter ATP-binding protein [Bacillota bacterium]